MNIRLLVGASLLTLMAASAARANLLVNGGLEPASGNTVNQYNLIYAPAGSTKITGWSITSNTVDLVPGAASGNGYWQNTEGSYSLDLVGTPGIGAISQHVTTVAATSYTFTFDLTFNPEVGPLLENTDTKILRVQAVAGDNTVLATQDFSGTAGTRTLANMQWASQSLSFTAIDTSVTLKLSALAPLNLPQRATASNILCGPVIDNLDLEIGGGVNQTPEPASLGVLGVGATALLVRRRRRTA